MSHDLGVTEALRSLPDVVVLLFALLTQLGDVWFYFVVLTLGYSFAGSLPRVGESIDRERLAFLVAIALGSIALSAGLKELFLHPRPTDADTLREIAWLPAGTLPLFEEFATADGYSFPSGHSVGSAAVYGGAALLVETGRRRVRYLVAALIVATIAASRVVIGVHFLGDVLFGVAVGAAYLGFVYSVAGRGADPTRAFTVVLLIATVAAASHFSPETMSALGGALGARLTWGVVGDRAVAGAVTRREGAVTTAVALPVGGGLVVGSVTLGGPVAGFLGNALGLAVVLGAPLVARRLFGLEPTG